MKLWHCPGSRSLRVLWALEELGLDCELVLLPFPPRLHQPEYLQVNPLGTVPFFRDEGLTMTESSAICQYLAERYGDGSLSISPGESDRGRYLDWLHQADATLTFPQTVYLRYRLLEPEAGLQAAGEGYARWFRSRLRALEDRLECHAYLAGGRFTMADIAVGYALHLATILGLDGDLRPATRAYLDRLRMRPAFARADGVGEPLVLPGL
ncbi:MAG: glutathione S-transferase family protein [Pseudomonadota bacterium]